VKIAIRYLSHWTVEKQRKPVNIANTEIRNIDVPNA